MYCVPFIYNVDEVRSPNTVSHDLYPGQDSHKKPVDDFLICNGFVPNFPLSTDGRTHVTCEYEFVSGRICFAQVENRITNVHVGQGLYSGKMPFVVLQLCGESCKILKAWFGVNVTDSLNFSEIYQSFCIGGLDGEAKIPAIYLESDCFPSVAVGTNKAQLTSVDLNAKAGEVVSVLGNFVEFRVSKKTKTVSLENEIPLASVNDVLMTAAKVS